MLKYPQIVPEAYLIDEDLPLLAQQKRRLVWRIWEPKQTIVVLGRSSAAEKEAYIDSCSAARVPILRRKGGGCTVVLGPGMLVLSIAYPVRSWNAESELLFWTRMVQSTLKQNGVTDLSIQGTSDLCHGDRKILGSCLYRASGTSFYQASLLVRPAIDVFEALLKEPVRMPAYRRNRPHGEFVTTLAARGYELACDQIAASLSTAMASEYLKGSVAVS